MLELLQISNADYHADTSRISKSGLDLIARSPRHYWQKYLAPERKPEARTPALIIGSAFHSAVLEPASFAAEYCAGIECDKRTKDGKQRWEEFVAANADKEVLPAADYAQILAMREAVLAHPGAARLLAGGQAEGTVHFTHAETGVKCKARLDWLHESGTAIVDLKSTEDASPAAFAKSVANYRYHVQAALYLDSFAYAGYAPPKRFVFVAVEKNPPYAVGLYVLDNEAIEVGRDVYTENLEAYARATHTNEWEAYGTSVATLQLPTWALNK